MHDDKSDGEADRGVDRRRRRRRFTTAEKIRILREADAAAHETGGVTALLRREGLYSSHLTSGAGSATRGEFGELRRGSAGRWPCRRIRGTRRSPSSSAAFGRPRRARERARALVRAPKKSIGAVGDPAGDRERDESLMQIVDETSGPDGVDATCVALGVCRGHATTGRASRACHGPRYQSAVAALAAARRAPAVLDVLHEDRFVDLAAAAGLRHAARRRPLPLLGAHDVPHPRRATHEVRERRDQLRHPRYAAPELLATAPEPALVAGTSPSSWARRSGPTSTCT